MQLNTLLPGFTLKGTDNKMHSPNDYTGNDAVVILFTCNHCPYARAYIGRISKLVADYEKKNIGFYAINANDVSKYPEDSFEKMIPMGKLLNLDGKYLYDETQEVAKTFGAQRTPEAFIFNRQKQLVYHGAIDDNYENANAVRQLYVKDAIETILGGNEVAVKETKVVGCTIKWKPEMVNSL